MIPTLYLIYVASSHNVYRTPLTSFNFLMFIFKLLSFDVNRNDVFFCFERVKSKKRGEGHAAVAAIPRFLSLRGERGTKHDAGGSVFGNVLGKLYCENEMKVRKTH